MDIQDNTEVIKQYYCILVDYLNMLKKVDSCSNEEKDFYKNLCFLFAVKIKNMKEELLKLGFIFS